MNRRNSEGPELDHPEPVATNYYDTSTVPPATVTDVDDTFQPMPDLPAEDLEALRANIAANGIVVPVLLDQHGRIIDGHHRVRIARELGIDFPTEVREVDDEEAMDLAFALNVHRRHLTREQVREIIRREISRRPGDSDRAIARRVGCSPTTVGTVRAGKVSKLDTSSEWTAPDDVDVALREIVLTNLDGWNLAPDLPMSDAEYQWLRVRMLHDVDRTVPLVFAIAAGADPLELAVAITGKMALYKSRGMDRRRIHDLFDPWLDIALSPSSRERFRTDPGMAPIVRCGEDPEFTESMLSLVASIPDGFRKSGAAA